MTQTAEEKLVELAKAYARHRKALRENSQAFRQIGKDHPEDDIDLRPYRADYIDYESDGGRTAAQWYGWAHAVDTVLDQQDTEDDDPPPRESLPIYKAAKLLDERKEINAQGARIRNRLRIIGDQLLRAEP